MPISRPREGLLLFSGDILFLACSLVLTLIVRYSTFPNPHLLTIHFIPFSFLFLVSTLVFFIAGLYEKHTLPMKLALPATIFYAQAANIIIGAAFFFLVPFFAIQPKAFLFIYLVISVFLVSLWRVYLFPILSTRKSEPALLIGKGNECREVFAEVNGNTRYAIRFESFYDIENGEPSPEEIVRVVREKNISVAVLPPAFARDVAFAPVWNVLREENVRSMDLAALYEEIFERVALPFVNERLFFKDDPFKETALYTALKRVMDAGLSFVALLVLSPLLLIVGIALKVGGSNALIFQVRVGKDNRLIRIIKFRTMLFDDAQDPEKVKQNRVTAFGALLRKWQIDEMPQFWNVLVGDLSLVGPRPEIPILVAEYEKQIPFYGARHLIQPGLSGWAQIKHASPPKWKLDVEATTNKLSYDLYYLKHRSIVVDTMVALRTVQIFFARAGK